MYALPYLTLEQQQIQDLQRQHAQQSEAVRKLQETIQGQQTTIGRLQEAVQQLQKQSATAIATLATSKKAPPREPSAYKPPQPRTCQKCDSTFLSGQALFKHLPDCQPFRCTKCESTFPTNTALHKHIRGCRRSHAEPQAEP